MLTQRYPTWLFQGVSYCISCPAGSDCDPTQDTLTTCGSGYYSLAGWDNCTACPAGYMCLFNSIAPIACWSGFYSLGLSTTCTQCPAGSECPDTR